MLYVVFHHVSCSHTLRTTVLKSPYGRIIVTVVVVIHELYCHMCPRRKKRRDPPSTSRTDPIPDPHKDEYSTVDECSSTLRRTSCDPSSPEDVPAERDPPVMVECDIYSEAADAVGRVGRNALPDISPYACFYGAPQQQVLKVGWLDKLSPQG